MLLFIVIQDNNFVKWLTEKEIWKGVNNNNINKLTLVGPQMGRK